MNNRKTIIGSIIISSEAQIASLIGLLIIIDRPVVIGRVQRL